MRSLPLALVLLIVAASATAARGACLDVPGHAELGATAPADDSHEGDCSDCDGACTDCGCCQAPMVMGAAPLAIALGPPHAHLAPHPAVLAGELHGRGVFQPPRG